MERECQDVDMWNIKFQSNMFETNYWHQHFAILDARMRETQ